MTTDERCENCRYFDRLSPGGDAGRCRVNPPARDRTWPAVAFSDWCGEWTSSAPIVEDLAPLPPLEPAEATE